MLLLTPDTIVARTLSSHWTLDSAFADIRYYCGDRGLSSHSNWLQVTSSHRTLDNFPADSRYYCGLDNIQSLNIRQCFCWHQLLWWHRLCPFTKHQIIFLLTHFISFHSLISLYNILTRGTIVAWRISSHWALDSVSADSRYCGDRLHPFSEH
jgi:hypothetical protein